MQASARLSSSAAFRKVIAGVSSTTTRSWTSRGKAHAAPLPAQEPPPKGRNRITVQERRARAVEFIENYRASNDGKFPTAKNLQKQVGGSYYTVLGVLQEMKSKYAKLSLVNVKPASLEGTVEVTEEPMRSKDEARVAESQGILEVSEHSASKDDAEVAQLQVTVEGVADEGVTVEGVADEGKVAQRRGTFQSLDLSWGENAKLDMDTAADAPSVSDQTETERMKDPTDNPEPGDQQREIGANKFNLKNFENPRNVNDPNGSDQSGSDRVNEAKMHAREDNAKLEESGNTGLLGSLKSLAYNIRNFWKNM